MPRTDQVVPYMSVGYREALRIRREVNVMAPDPGEAVTLSVEGEERELDPMRVKVARVLRVMG